MRVHRLAGILLALQLAAACGGGDGAGGTGPSQLDLEGTYVGTATITNQNDPGNPFTTSFTVVGVRDANGLSGVWDIGGSTGTLAGNLSGGTVSFTLIETSPCPGSFTGTADVSDDGDHAVGTFTGNDCDGTQTVTFTLDRNSGGTNLTGDYVGTATVTGAGAVDVQITVIQRGNGLSGTWSSEIGGAGTAGGVVTGTSVAFTLTQTVPCPGSYSGSGQIQNGGSRLTGSYSGSDCGLSISATFTVNRQ